MGNSSENKDMFYCEKGATDTRFPQSSFLATVKQKDHTFRCLKTGKDSKEICFKLN